MAYLRLTLPESDLETLKSAAALDMLPTATWARNTLIRLAREAAPLQPAKEDAALKAQHQLLAKFKATLAAAQQGLFGHYRDIPSYLAYRRTKLDATREQIEYDNAFATWARENGHLKEGE